LEASPVGWNDANVYNLRGERSLDAFDVSQHLVLASVLDLPFGKGKKFANNLNGIANKLVSGWGIDTIITFQRGFPIIIGGAGPAQRVRCPERGLFPQYQNGPVEADFRLSGSTVGSLV